MKAVFALLIAVHGAIHLMGFARAFGIGSRGGMIADVSRMAGLVWLVTALLMVTVAVIIWIGKDWWYLGLAGLLLSQILIISTWKDAGYGTWLNVLLLLAVVLNYSDWQFRLKGKREAQALLATENVNRELLTDDEIIHLPASVQKWLHHSGAVGRPIVHTARLRQKGTLRTKYDGAWMSMNADQYFTTSAPGFIWVSKIRSGLMYVAGKDKYAGGAGNMQIRVLSMFPVADTRGMETSQGSMLRFLAEMEWFPSAAICPYVSWTDINERSAKATISYGGITASGVFDFTKEGDVANFSADRYMEHDGIFTLEKWYVPVTDYGVFQGIRIPVKGKAIWKLKSGDFNWFNWEIADIEYNTLCAY